jgi:crotonobetainyl-CoA:carnitine CoA-transferase CaiB-like acyl-CoA transferase
MPGPLDGIRIFDATVFMVGPWASMLLGSLGADVLHVEQPDVDWSDLCAGIPPTVNGTSVGYLAWNMNKRGVAIDMKIQDELEFAYGLIETCDVFLCNMRAGAADRLGLGYEKLSALNPRLVYCLATGQGRSGPRTNQRGTDNSIQALTGFWSAQGARGEDGEMYRHYAQLDATTGNVMAQAILLALYTRKRTGRGQFVEVTMLDASATLQATRLAEQFAGVMHEPQGSSAFPTAPDRAFRCLDNRWIGVTATSDPEWDSLCRAVGRTELSADARFETNAARVRNRSALEDILVGVFLSHPRPYWELILSRAGVVWGAPMGWEELRHHAQVTENESLIEVDTVAWGKIWAGGPPWHFSKTPARVFGPPIPGIDTDELKHELESLKKVDQ